MSQFNILMFYGSTRPDRLGIRLVNFIRTRLEDLGHVVTLFDAMEMPFPIVQKPLHFYHDRSQAPEYLKAANKVIEQADGFVVVNGEYNRSVQPGLTNMLDHFPPASYAKRPCAFASYSMGIGPALLSTSHMRDVVAELGMIVSPKVCGVIEIHKEFDENNQLMNEEVRGRRDEMIEDFLWLCDALKSKRKDNE